MDILLLRVSSIEAMTKIILTFMGPGFHCVGKC